MSSGAELENGPTGKIEMLFTDGLGHITGASEIDKFTNRGVVERLAGASAGTVSWNVAFEHRGQLLIESGELLVTAKDDPFSSTWTAHIAVYGSGVLAFAGGKHTFGNALLILGDGTLRFDSGTSIIQFPVLDFHGLFHSKTSVSILSGTQINEIGKTLWLTAGQLSVEDVFLFATNIVVEGGSMTTRGDVTVGGNFTMRSSTATFNKRLDVFEHLNMEVSTLFGYLSRRVLFLRVGHSR